MARQPHDVDKHFRFTRQEAEALSRNAREAEMSESDYVRALVTDPGRVFTTDGDALRKIYRELKRQGTNLNQVAHQANRGKVGPAENDLLSTIADANASMAKAVLKALDGR